MTRDGNHALLVGVVWGALAGAGLEVEPQRDDDGNYTGELIVTRPSGRYRVDVTPLDPPVPDVLVSAPES